jgi:hypothetical protein
MNMRRLLSVAAAALAVACAVQSASALTTIDTTPSWNGYSYIYPFGHPDTATYGQTVTAPSVDTRLDSFSFYMDLDPSVVFRGYVYAWDGAKATGPALYTSADTAGPGAGAFYEVAFNTGGVNLTGGNAYVLFCSVSGIAGQQVGGSWGYIWDSNAYPGGELQYTNNDDDPSLWTSQNWGTFISGDMAFKATFNSPQVIPEPVTVCGLLMGLGSIAVAARRRLRG